MRPEAKDTLRGRHARTGGSTAAAHCRSARLHGSHSTTNYRLAMSIISSSLALDVQNVLWWAVNDYGRSMQLLVYAYTAVTSIRVVASSTPSVSRPIAMEVTEGMQSFLHRISRPSHRPGIAHSYYGQEFESSCPRSAYLLARTQHSTGSTCCVGWFILTLR